MLLYAGITSSYYAIGRSCSFKYSNLNDHSNKVKTKKSIRRKPFKLYNFISLSLLLANCYNCLPLRLPLPNPRAREDARVPRHTA